jgi:hypothetical protein
MAQQELRPPGGRIVTKPVWIPLSGFTILPQQIGKYQGVPNPALFDESSRRATSASPINRVRPKDRRAMGWSYRKSVNLGPFRVNLSKSGVGYSVGGKDFRVGVNSKGRRYEALTVPGTGLHYRSEGKSRGQASGCMGVVLLMVLLAAAGIQLFLYSW